MNQTRVISVGQGSRKVLVEPGSLKATVGPGFVVAVYADGAAFAGMLNLCFDAPGTERGISGNFGRLRARLEDFVAHVFNRVPDFKKANADIVGGADILCLYSRGKRDRVSRTHAAAIEGFLRSKNIQTKRLDVGGTRGRTVLLDLRADGTSVCRVMKLGSGDSELDVRPRNGKKVPTPNWQRSARSVINVEVGKMIVDSSPAKFSAVLGSCVGVALEDCTTGVGGLSHVMIPSSNGEDVNNPSKYADLAVPALVEAVEKAGAVRQKLQAKIAGGANVLHIGNRSHVLRIGEQNIVNVKTALAAERIPVLSEDTGGSVGRKIWVDLRTFDMKVKRLPGNH